MPIDAGTHPRKPSVIIFTLYLSPVYFLCVLSLLFYPHMSCQQTPIGNRVSNLTNGSLTYSFEKENIIRHRRRGRHKRKESNSDACSVYQTLRSRSPKIRGNVSTPTNTKWKSAYRSSPNPGLSPFFPPLSSFPGLRHASFWLVALSNRWPARLLETSNWLCSGTSRCASSPRGGGSWESYSLWESCLCSRMIRTFI